MTISSDLSSLLTKAFIEQDGHSDLRLVDADNSGTFTHGDFIRSTKDESKIIAFSEVTDIEKFALQLKEFSGDEFFIKTASITPPQSVYSPPQRAIMKYALLYKDADSLRNDSPYSISFRQDMSGSPSLVMKDLKLDQTTYGQQHFSDITASADKKIEILEKMPRDASDCSADLPDDQEAECLGGTHGNQVKLDRLKIIKEEFSTQYQALMNPTEELSKARDNLKTQFSDPASSQEDRMTAVTAFIQAKIDFELALQTQADRLITDYRRAVDAIEVSE